jgi:hypothetical protein
MPRATTMRSVMEMIPTCALGSVACVASEVLSSSYWGSGVAVDVAPELLWPEHGADVLAAAALVVVAAAAALVVAAADQLQLSLEDSAYWVVVSLKQK